VTLRAFPKITFRTTNRAKVFPNPDTICASLFDSQARTMPPVTAREFVGPNNRAQLNKYMVDTAISRMLPTAKRHIREPKADHIDLHKNQPIWTQ
jgi:hypothetical protein